MDHPSNTSPAPSNAFNSRLALVMRQLDDVKAENRSLKERLERLEAGESEARNIIFRVGQRLAEIEDTFHSTASRQGISDGAVAATVMLDDKREKRAELQRENRVAACIAHMKHAARYRVPESERSHDTGGRGATISTSDRGEANAPPISDNSARGRSTASSSTGSTICFKALCGCLVLAVLALAAAVMWLQYWSAARSCKGLEAAEQQLLRVLEAQT